MKEELFRKFSDAEVQATDNPLFAEMRNKLISLNIWNGEWIGKSKWNRKVLPERPLNEEVYQHIQSNVRNMNEMKRYSLET